MDTARLAENMLSLGIKMGSSPILDRRVGGGPKIQKFGFEMLLKGLKMYIRISLKTKIKTKIWIPKFQKLL